MLGIDKRPAYQEPPLEHDGPEKIGRIRAFMNTHPVLQWLFDERKAPVRSLSRDARGNYRRVQTGWRCRQSGTNHSPDRIPC
jgi:hypothetical protein